MSSATRSTRLIALLIGLSFLALIAAFVVIAFNASDEVPLNAVGPVARSAGAEKGGVVFRGTANIWEVRGQLTQDADGRATVSLQLIGPTGQPPARSLALSASLQRPDQHDTAQPLALSPQGPGQFAGQSAPLAAGPWQLRLHFPEVVARFSFTAEP